MQVYVLNDDEELQFKEASVDIPVQYQDDHSMNFGVEQVTSQGKEGKATIVSKRVKTVMVLILLLNWQEKLL